MPLPCHIQRDLMFAIGHFALGYLAGKGSSKVLKTRLNLPLLLAVSVLPDVDMILQVFAPNLIMHRGALHSVFTLTLFMIPVFILYRRRALPYYAALLTHSFLGDFFTDGVQLFWPLSHDLYGVSISPMSLPSVSAELALFAVTVPLMFWAGDLQALWRPGSYKLMLIVAGVAVLGTLTIIPAPLLLPSLFWLGIFAYSVFVGLQRMWSNG